jgi:uncharacterized protein DUF2505
MKIERVMQHDITPEQVYAMSCSKEFQERKCADAGALSWHVTVSADGDDTVVRTKRKLPTVGFPSLIRKIVPSGVTSTETVTWAPAAADGSRSGALHVDFHGAPARMHGTVHIVALAAGRAEVFLAAEFTALVPLIGSKIEKLAAPIITGVIDAEEETGKAWVAAAQ